jgi:hypothetical protein
MPKAPDNATPDHPPTGFDALGGVLAFAVPGLGYFSRGEVKRGAYLLGGVLALVATGLFVGGLSSVDKANAFWWFLAQAGLGPLAWMLDGLRVSTGAVPSIGRANEIGTLFVVMAGMCNAIAVIDCLIPTLHDKKADGGAS